MNMATTNSMPTCHRLICTFAHTRIGELLSCTGPLSHLVEAHWAELSPLISSSLPQQSAVPVSARGSLENYFDFGISSTTKSFLKLGSIHQDDLVVYQLRQELSSTREVVLGALIRQPRITEPEVAHSLDSVVDDVFVHLLLKAIRLFTSPALPEARDQVKYTTDKIVDIFDKWLRYSSNNDKWYLGGRDYFFGRVYEFVRRGEKLEFCLPAFPCKSSNLDKVHGVMPDMGEQLALEHLHSFLEAIDEIYEPGAKLLVVSDGHVFSDCSEFPPIIRSITKTTVNTTPSRSG